MIGRFTLPQSGRSLADIWRWHEFSLRSYAKLESRILAGEIIDDEFLLLRPDEARARIDEHRKSLGYLTSLDLITAVEGALREDFAERVRLRKKDDLSRAYRELERQFGKKARLESILDALKTVYVTEFKAVGEFKGLLDLRDWLAHGRYWKMKLGRDYTPEQIFEICNQLLEEAETMP
jgi:hypothetical protein